MSQKFPSAGGPPAGASVGHNFKKLLDAIGVTAIEFDATRSSFELSPSEWLEKRLRAAGWVRREEAVSEGEKDAPVLA